MNRVILFGAVVAITAGTTALADSHEDYRPVQSGTVRPYAPAPSRAMLSGTIQKDNDGEGLTFNLKVSCSEEGNYTVEGSTDTDKGFIRTHLKFDGIQVTKDGYIDGKRYQETLPNEGLMQVFPRKRRFQGATLAGSRIDGEFVNGMFNYGTYFRDSLSVDGEPSHGRLDYVSFSGRFNAKDGLSFGDTPIQSTMPGRNTAINFDDFPYSQNQMLVTMRFGNLNLQGKINFTDTKQRYCSTDDDGDTTCVSHTSSTIAKLNVRLSHPDGSAVKCATPGATPTPDDATVRKLIAFLETTGYDIFGE